MNFRRLNSRTRRLTDRAGRAAGMALAAVTFAVAACGGDDPAAPGGGGGGGGGGGTNGTFTATMSGDLQGSFSGNAVFAVVPTGEAESGQAFGLTLGDQEAGGESFGLQVFLDGTRPSAGTYSVSNGGSGGDITSGSGAALLSYSSGGSSAASGTAASGQLTITNSAASEVGGSMSLQLDLRFGDGSTGTATVTGDFSAIGGSVAAPGS